MFIQNSIEKNFREITGKLALIIITDQPSTRRGCVTMKLNTRKQVAYCIFTLTIFFTRFDVFPKTRT